MSLVHVHAHMHARARNHQDEQTQITQAFNHRPRPSRINDTGHGGRQRFFGICPPGAVSIQCTQMLGPWFIIYTCCEHVQADMRVQLSEREVHTASCPLEF